jgi:ubiquinone/menaquinone biosynthesis C-methylase UbiE
MNNKKQVHDFWNKASCGEDLYLTTDTQEGYEMQSKIRYELEGDIILPFANFTEYKELKVLEIGVGLGADHQKFAEAGADLYGIDLTNRAINNSSRRLDIFNLKSKLMVGDAENMEYTDNFFDLVYSWGVLHHSSDTPKAVAEVWRVLKKGGTAKIMIYHKWSIVGYMLWMRYALLRLRVFTSLKEIYSRHLESPGTKAYSISQARELFANFRDIKITSPLTHGDLLESNVGQRHRGFLLTLSKKVLPRWFIRRFMKNSGLFMLIELKK